MCFVASVQPASFLPLALPCRRLSDFPSLCFRPFLRIARKAVIPFSAKSAAAGIPLQAAGFLLFASRLHTAFATRTCYYTSTTFTATYLLINCPPHPQAISDRSAPFFLLTARSWTERPIQAFVAASHSPSLWTRCKLPSGRFYSLDL